MTSWKNKSKNIEVVAPRANKFLVNGHLKEFPYYVISAVIMQDRIIVAYDWDELKQHLSGFDSDRAVWCYDLKGNTMWYVEKPYYIDKNTGKKVIYDQPFIGVGCNLKTGKLFAYSRRGYELDPYTGKLSNDFEIR